MQCKRYPQGQGLSRREAEAHLDERVDLRLIRLQVLRLRLRERAARLHAVRAHDQRRERRGRRAGGQARALLQRLQHVEEAVRARGRQHRRAQLQRGQVLGANLIRQHGPQIFCPPLSPSPTMQAKSSNPLPCLATWLKWVCMHTMNTL
jgi:hypothetical protein